MSVDFVINLGIDLTLLLDSVPSDALQFYYIKNSISDTSVITLKSLGIQSRLTSSIAVTLSNPMAEIGVNATGTFLSTEMHTMFIKKGSGYD